MHTRAVHPRNNLALTEDQIRRRDRNNCYLGMTPTYHIIADNNASVRSGRLDLGFDGFVAVFARIYILD